MRPFNPLQRGAEASNDTLTLTSPTLQLCTPVVRGGPSKERSMLTAMLFWGLHPANRGLWRLLSDPALLAHERRVSCRSLEELYSCNLLALISSAMLHMLMRVQALLVQQIEGGASAGQLTVQLSGLQRMQQVSAACMCVCSSHVDNVAFICALITHLWGPWCSTNGAVQALDPFDGCASAPSLVFLTFVRYSCCSSPPCICCVKSAALLSSCSASLAGSSDAEQVPGCAPACICSNCCSIYLKLSGLICACVSCC